MGAAKFLDMLLGAAQGKAVAIADPTTDANFSVQAKVFFDTYSVDALENLQTQVLLLGAESLAARAQTDVNVRAALAGLTVVSVAVDGTVADQLSLYDATTGQGDIRRARHSPPICIGN